MTRPIAYNPEQNYKYQILVKYGCNSYDHCDYAIDKQELIYLLNEYRISYQGQCLFKTILLPKKYWPDFRYKKDIISMFGNSWLKDMPENYKEQIKLSMKRVEMSISAIELKQDLICDYKKLKTDNQWDNVYQKQGIHDILRYMVRKEYIKDYDIS